MVTRGAEGSAWVQVVLRLSARASTRQWPSLRMGSLTEAVWASGAAVMSLLIKWCSLVQCEAQTRAVTRPWLPSHRPCVFGPHAVADTNASAVEFTMNESFAAWGGGVGMSAGTLFAVHSTWTRSAVLSRYFNAWGGGLGMTAGSTATLHDSSFEGCSASGATWTSNGQIRGWDSGGSIGLVDGSTADLFNVTMTNSATRTHRGGEVLFTPSRALTAAFVTIRQPPCTATATACPSCNVLIHINEIGGGALLLRNLDLDAPGCNVLPAESSLMGCDDAVACGPKSVCSMSDHPVVPTPICDCEPHDPIGPFVQPVPFPEARSPEIAPYTPQGCVKLPLDQRRLNRNWWRASTMTDDVRPCVAFWSPGQPTPCLGGYNTSEYCVPGHTGPLCQSCIEDGFYFDASEARCNECAVTGAVAVLLPLAIWLCVVVTAVAIYKLGKQIRQLQHGLGNNGVLHRCGAQRVLMLARHVTAILPRIGLVAKTKIAVGYFQVALVMPELFSLSLPPEYHRFVRVFAWVNLDWFSIAVPEACVGSFGVRLLFMALGPPVLLALLASFGALARVVASHHAGGLKKCAIEDAWRGILDTLPIILAALFAFVPPVSSRIFSTWSCEQFGYSASKTISYLYADYAVQCLTSKHAALIATAIPLILLWPVGGGSPHRKQRFFAHIVPSRECSWR